MNGIGEKPETLVVTNRLILPNKIYKEDLVDRLGKIEVITMPLPLHNSRLIHDGHLLHSKNLAKGQINNLIRVIVILVIVKALVRILK